jgi:Ca2+-binding EF-hand superfamily protein
MVKEIASSYILLFAFLLCCPVVFCFGQQEFDANTFLSSADRNSDGKLSTKEVKRAFRLGYKKWSRREAYELHLSLVDNWKELDINADGAVSVAEIIGKSAAGLDESGLKDTFAEVFELFNLSDENGDGLLSSKEFEEYAAPEMNKFAHPRTQFSLKASMTEFDVNKDDQLSYSEYTAGAGPRSDLSHHHVEGEVNWNRYPDLRDPPSNPSDINKDAAIAWWIPSILTERIAFFEFCDENDDGQICELELPCLLNSANMKFHIPAETSYIFKATDVDGDGFLTLSEMERNRGAFHKYLYADYYKFNGMLPA